jgi:hypothetical protein
MVKICSLYLESVNSKDKFIEAKPMVELDSRGIYSKGSSSTISSKIFFCSWAAVSSILFSNHFLHYLQQQQLLILNSEIFYIWLNIIILYMEKQSLCQSIILPRFKSITTKKNALKTSINILCKICKVFYFK